MGKEIKHWSDFIENKKLLAWIALASLLIGITGISFGVYTYWVRPVGIEATYKISDLLEKIVDFSDPEMGITVLDSDSNKIVSDIYLVKMEFRNTGSKSIITVDDVKEPFSFLLHKSMNFVGFSNIEYIGKGEEDTLISFNIDSARVEFVYNFKRIDKNEGVKFGVLFTVDTTIANVNVSPSLEGGPLAYSLYLFDKDDNMRVIKDFGISLNGSLRNEAEVKKGNYFIGEEPDIWKSLSSLSIAFFVSVLILSIFGFFKVINKPKEKKYNIKEAEKMLKMYEVFKILSEELNKNK